MLRKLIHRIKSFCTGRKEPGKNADTTPHIYKPEEPPDRNEPPEEKPADNQVTYIAMPGGEPPVPLSTTVLTDADLCEEEPGKIYVC